MNPMDFNKIELNKKIRVGLGLALFILVLSSASAYYCITKLIEQSRWVDHTTTVIANLEKILAKVKSAETDQRGFLLSGESSFLKSYETSKHDAMALCDNVEKLTADNPIQQLHIANLKPKIAERYTKLHVLIDVYKATQKAPKDRVMDGQHTMDQCIDIISDMQNEERRLLDIRREKAAKYIYYSPIIILASSLFAIFISLLSYYFISKDINNKVAIQNELVTLNSKLSENYKELEESRNELDKQNYLLLGNAKINDLLRSEKSLYKSGENIVQFLCAFSKSQVSVLYIHNDDGSFTLSNTCAVHNREDIPQKFKLGEGLLGHVAANKTSLLLKDIDANAIKIESGLLSTLPKNILIVPFVHDDQTIAVIELLSINEFLPVDIGFIETIGRIVAVNFKNIHAEMKMAELLEETQRQTEELEAQQEVLKQINAELEEQAHSLKIQQEELQVANEELEQQSKNVEYKNKALETAQQEIQKKSEDLEQSSKYKSEFLANMSHELRTPLNSLLILSRDLADNKKKNLDDTQVESAQIIYNSGQDLLQLINEILDLSKIEAGRMELYPERLSLTSFANHIARNFKHVAEKKNLQFIIHIDEDMPEAITTDRQRLEQILRNLLSNAIKFTQQGSITVNFKKQDESNIAIHIVDTGIGIPEDKLSVVFEAFRQADGGTSRKYGGTGLGLSISKELAKLIKGRIALKSKPNEGSTFTVILPLDLGQEHVAVADPVEIAPTDVKIEKPQQIQLENIPDDRDEIVSGDRILLIIEDDFTFAKILMGQAKARKFKVLAASTGEEGLSLAQKYSPHAIILDLGLPLMDGQSVLGELKNNPYLRHIPVHIISASDRSVDIIKRGAIEFLKKPLEIEDLERAFNRIENIINRKMKNLLLIEDDLNAIKAMKLVIGNGDVKCWEAQTGKEALRIMKETEIDCIVLDLMLPDMTGFDFIDHLKQSKGHTLPPIIVYTGKDLSKDESAKLQSLAETIIIKGVRSEERLLDETALFLHRTVENLPEAKKNIITELYNKDQVLHGKSILVVDDDMRNIFALTKLLKDAGLEVLKAENGLKALEMLGRHPDLHLVLMDIMMPEMDGYEAMKSIRSQDRFKDLPIIALTAKAMKEDKLKCLEAGANDYITKPLDIDRLLSLIRVWIKK